MADNPNLDFDCPHLAPGEAQEIDDFEIRSEEKEIIIDLTSSNDAQEIDGDETKSEEKGIATESTSELQEVSGNDIREEVIVSSEGYVRGTYPTHKKAKEEALHLLHRFFATGGGGSSSHILNRYV